MTCTNADEIAVLISNFRDYDYLEYTTKLLDEIKYIQLSDELLLDKLKHKKNMLDVYESLCFRHSHPDNYKDIVLKRCAFEFTQNDDFINIINTFVDCSDSEMFEYNKSELWNYLMVMKKNTSDELAINKTTLRSKYIHDCKIEVINIYLEKLLDHGSVEELMESFYEPDM